MERKVFREIPILNPFIRESTIWDRMNAYDKIKSVILTVLLVPLRLTCMVLILLVAWIFAHIGLLGYSREDLKMKPIQGWRRVFRTIVGYLFRSIYFFGSANWVTVKGKLASIEEAPILVAAPHTSFFDALSVIISGPSSVVGKIEAGDIPFYGKLIDMAQPIYVCREDHNSRATTIQDILHRVRSLGEWKEIGRVLIFPEGTCTNRSSLIQFKPGAFYPSQPVQPVLIRYPNKIDTFTWTWQGPSVILLLWRTLTQFQTFVEIEFLPTYVPSEEEKSNAKIYANNVRKVMARALSLPVSDYSFDDCKLMEYASNSKMYFASKIADVSKLRIQIGLASSQIEEYIVKDNFPGTDSYFVNFEQFVNRLKIPADDYSYTLFKLFWKPGQIETEIIDFKEYLLHALFLIKEQESKIQLVEVLFMLYGDSVGRVNRENFHQILSHVLKLPRKKIDVLFFSLDIHHLNLIIFQDFFAATKHDLCFKSLYSLNRNFRHKKIEK